MNIALLNNRYFMVGGTTRYLFNVQALLESHGHRVIPFSNRYSETVDTPYLEDFVEPAGDPAATFFKDARPSARDKLSLLGRGIYSRRVRRALLRLIDKYEIDLVYSVNICNFLGPSVIDAARERGVPYVMRLSDFNLLCPSYLMLRDGRVCEECVDKGLLSAVRHRCLQGSPVVSLARVMAMWSHRATGIYNRVSEVVTPSAFLRSTLHRSGYDKVPIHHVPTFVDLDLHAAASDASGNEVLYLGHLSEHKGVDTLIRAFAQLPESCALKLVLLGRGEGPYMDELRRLAAGAGGRVEFAGFVDGERVRQRMSRALAVAHPARWYENMPNSVTEAMAMSRPVLASRIGSLPEQVLDGETGRLLPPEDPGAWSRALLELDSDRARAEAFGRAGRARAVEEFSSERHYQRLMKIFESAKSRCASRV